MARNNSQQSRYRMISIMTFMVLVLAFAYYYFIYVKSNEDAFNGKSFRIIEQQSNVVESIYSNYKKIVHNAWNNRSENYENEKLTAQTFVSRVPLKDIVNGAYNVPENIIVINGNKDKLLTNLLLIDSVQVPIANGGDFSVYFYTEALGLVEGALGNDFFEEYVMFSFDQVFWSSFRTTNTLSIHNDTLFKRDKGELNNLFHSTDRLDFEFNNETQLLYFTPVKVSSEAVFIGGVINKNRFSQQVFKLGTNTMIVILVIPLLLIFSMPFLKLLLLSENERLGTWDAILSFVVMALGFGFLLLSFLAFYTQSGPSAKEKNQSLRTYARQIEKNFFKELNDILTQIDSNQLILGEVNNQFSGQSFSSGKWVYDKTADSPSYGKSIYPYSLGMSWMNSDAEQLVKWQPDHITPRVKVPFRKYFSVPNSNQNRLWKNSKVNNGSGFYIEAIRAVTTGASYAVVSKRSDSITLPHVGFENKRSAVVTMGSKFQSLTGVSLPDNILYIVIDEEGEVLFHKNSARILQENIFDETNFDPMLSEAVYGRVDTIFKSNYNEVHSRFYILPLENVPLFLLLVMDEDKEKMSDAQVLSLTAFLFILLFFLLFFQIALFVFVDYQRKKKAKGYSLFFKWVWPIPTKKWAFQLLSIYLFISFLVFLVGSFYENTLVTYSFFSFLVSINLFVLRRFKKPFSLSVKAYYLKYYIYFALMFLIGFLLFPFSDTLSQNQWLCFLAFLIISFVTLIASFFIADADQAAAVQFTYNVWAFLFILLLGSLSVLSFYTRAYNFEKTISIQHQQLDLANNLIENNAQSDTIKYHNFKSVNKIFFQPIVDSSDHASQPRDLSLLRYIRIQLNKDKTLSAILQYPDASSKEQMQWFETASEIQLKIESDAADGKMQDSVVLTSYKKSLHPLDFLLLRKFVFDGYRLEMFFGFLVFLILLYLVVAYWSSKLFLLGIIPKLKSNISDLLHQSDFIYVVSPPHAGVRPFIEKELDLPIYVEDIRYTSNNKEIEPAKSDQIALLFDAGSIDTETLKKSVQRIDALKQLVLKKRLSKLIVVSQFTPKKVLNTVKEREQLLRETDQASTLSELKKLSDQYLDIIGGFSLAYYKIGLANLRDGEKVSEFLDFELKGVNILDEQMISKIFKRSDYDQEDMVLNIQNKAQLYYYAIWNSLEKRERLLIYDLAQDGLVNYRNLYVIYNLMSRGILVFKNGRLMLFNRSFANFILSIVDIEQALEFERDAKRTGNWANLKLPFLLVIAAALMFMFLTQQDVFNELIGWFTAAIAILPILTRFILTFSGFSGKK